MMIMILSQAAVLLTFLNPGILLPQSSIRGYSVASVISSVRSKTGTPQPAP